MPSLVVEACSVLGLEPGPNGTPPLEEDIAKAFKKLAVKWRENNVAAGIYETKIRVRKSCQPRSEP